MKKITHISLVVACLTTAFSAIAHDTGADISVRWGGSVDTQYGSNTQKTTKADMTKPSNTAAAKSASNASKPARGWARTTANLGLSIQAETTEATYGGTVQIEDKINSADESMLHFKRAYMSVAAQFGRLEFGINEGVEHTLGINASAIASATGGIDGDMSEYVDFNSYRVGNIADSSRGYYIYTPGMHVDDNGIRKRANKVSYYTPEYHGVQWGISFTPDYDSTARSKAVKHYRQGGQKPYTLEVRDVIGTALRFNHQFSNDVGLALSVSGLYGTPKKTYTEPGVAVATRDSYHRLAAHSVGAQLTLGQFSFVASFTDQGKSLVRKDINRNLADMAAASSVNRLDRDPKSSFFTAGVSYNQGPVNVSVTHLAGKRMGNRSAVTSLGIDYMPMQGVIPYAEVSFYELKSNKNTLESDLQTRNRGTVVIGGVRLKF